MVPDFQIGKKALGFEKTGRAYAYYPLVGERECARAERRSLLGRVYGGSLRPMLAEFLEDEERRRSRSPIRKLLWVLIPAAFVIVALVCFRYLS